MTGIVWSEDGKLLLEWDDGTEMIFEAIIPAPFMSEIERQERVKKAIDSKYLEGYFVEIKGRVRNKAFDKKGEKTTIKIVYRPCRSEDEAKFVISKVQELINKERGEIAEYREAKSEDGWLFE